MTYQDDIPTTKEVAAQEASQSSKVFIDASVGRLEDSTREPGLILTKDQIKNIKKYEMTGLKLPTEINAVMTYLGYPTSAGLGLAPVDFQKTFTTVHDHAATWNPLRMDLIGVGEKLNAFAGQMQVYGKGMEDIFQDIKEGQLKQYDIKTLDDLRKVELKLGSHFPGLELDADDKETVKDFNIYLDKMLASVKVREAEANQIKTRLATFSFELTNTVYREVQLRLSAIDNNTLSDEIKALSIKIEERSKNIDIKTKEYNDLVQKALSSAGGMNIVGIGMSIYIGAQAEKVRKERNQLRKEQERDIAAMKDKDFKLARLSSIRLELQELDMIIIDADIATKNLVTVWNKIELFVNQSSEAVDEISDGLRLRRFILEFRLVVSPWETIKKDSHLLLEVFKQADEEFRIEYEQKEKGV